MRVLKRDGKIENLSLDNILYRLKGLSTNVKELKKLGLSKLDNIDPDLITMSVVSRLYDNIPTSIIDEEAARISNSHTEHPEYSTLALRIIVSNHHRNTEECFSEVMEKLWDNYDQQGTHTPITNETFMALVRKYKNELNDIPDYTLDYSLCYIGFQQLFKSYLLKKNTNINGKLVLHTIERPQHMYLRVALTLYKDNIEKVKEAYEYLSKGYYTQASPTLFNSGTCSENLSSCFLLYTQDSLPGIFKTMTDTAMISKCAGGVGIPISNIRAKGSIIRGTNGPSDGIIPMMKVYNEIGKYVNQGGRRKGAIALYIEPHHADILDFLNSRKAQTHEDMRAKDLFPALWISDLFMKQVKENGDWWLMCPDKSFGLVDTFGDEFEINYWKHVESGNFIRKIKAQDLWIEIMKSQIETGTPYMLYKDSINKKNNQCNLGMIKSSNLCAEILLYSDEHEYGTCNLESIALPKFVIKNRKNSKPVFNHEFLHTVVKNTIESMNSVIDTTYYPIPETKLSNTRHRPIGVGVQGLHDTYIKMRYPFESDEAKQLNIEIFETIYHACIEGSMELAKIHGPYSSFEGSPFSQGLFQFDLWKKVNPELDLGKYLSSRYNWASLREDVTRHGLRNSMFTTCMPSVSTAQILDNTEAIEPFDSCIFKRRTIAGEFTIVYKYLVEDLLELGLWNNDLKNTIIRDGGSIQNIDSIPQHIKNLYKTAWEISQRFLIDQSADRALFIDHTQSLNLFVAQPTFKTLSSMHMYAWGKGLKTGLYYLRSKPQTRSTDLTSNVSSKQTETTTTTTTTEQDDSALLCSLVNRDECTMCSS
jgi:ribonucleoside-diphosphate reductase alpha chain